MHAGTHGKRRDHPQSAWALIMTAYPAHIPHSFNHHLCACRHTWEALGPPAECLGFDFHESAANMEPASVELALPITEHGICNAMAFWFELHLDEHAVLSTSPYVDKARPQHACNHASMQIDHCQGCWITGARPGLVSKSHRGIEQIPSSDT